MTHAYVGLALLDAAYLAAGLGLLAGLGYVRSARSAARLAGLAFTVGWAAAGVSMVLALVLGLALERWQILAICGALAVGGLGASRRTRPVTEPAPPSAVGGQWLALVSIGVLLLYAQALGRRAFAAAASYHQDAWAFWLPKAKSIVLLGGLETGPGGATSFAHADYPPLVPALEAASFRFAGGLEASLLPVQEWVLAVGFVAALGGLLSRRVQPVVLWSSLALLALMPTFGRHNGLSLADQRLAMLFALAGVCAALWLREGEGRHAILCGLLLAAAALTKKEGLLLGLVLVAVLVLASAGELRTRWRTLAGLLAVPVAAVLPWRIWLAVNDVASSRDYRLSRLLDPGLLVDRGDRLRIALTELPGYVLGPGRWLLAVPLVLVAALLIVARERALAVLIVGTILACFLGLAVVYWVGDLPVESYIDTSAERAVSSLVLFAAALFPLALASALDEPPRERRSRPNPGG